MEWINWVTTGCLPDHRTNVVIDSNSFSTNGAMNILINTTAHCRNLTWDNSTSLGSTITLNDDINIYGDFIVSPNMGSISGQSSVYLNGASNTFDNNNVYVPNVIINRYTDYTFI